MAPRLRFSRSAGNGSLAPAAPHLRDSSRRRKSMKTAKVSSIVFVLGFLLGAPIHGEAVSFNLSKVVDKSTPIPGGTGNFACLGDYAISGSNVVFWGSGFRPPFFCEPSGIY